MPSDKIFIDYADLYKYPLNKSNIMVEYVYEIALDKNGNIILESLT